MARNESKKRIAITIAAAIIAATPVLSTVPARAAAATAAVKVTSVSSVVKPIYLSSKSYMNLVDIGLRPTDGGQVASFTVSIYNGDSKELDLGNYWYRLYGATGNAIALKVSSADAKVSKIAPNSKKFITLYATVGQSVKLSDLKFRLVKFDFSKSGYEVPVGTFTLPKSYTNEVVPGSYKVLYFNNTLLNSKIYTASIGASGDDNLANITFVYNNVGKAAVTLSKYKYYIQTAEGIIYDCTPSVTEDLVIAPLNRKELTLTAAIPSSLKTKGWKLLVTRDSGGETALELPVGAYQIKFGSATTTTTSNEFQYTNTEGTYQISQLRTLRQPWDSQDILTTKIRIQNKGTDAATMPAISGYYYLDNKVKLDFKTIETNNQLGLSAGGYVDVDVYAKLPSDYKYSSVKLVLNNKVDDKTTTKLGELSAAQTIVILPSYNADQSYKITRSANQATAVINSVNVYKGTTTKLFTTQVALTNDESRTVDPIKLTGFFKSDDGDIYPATKTLADGKMNPKNKALMTFSATVPLNYDTSKLKLIIGEAVTDTKYTEGTAVADAYVNAAQFTLPADRGVNALYKDVQLEPYTFTINKITPQVFAQAEGQEIQLALTYDLIKDASYNVFSTDRKLQLTVEGKDPDTGTVYTYFAKEFTLEGENDALKVGEDQKITLKANSEYNGINKAYMYTVRLYETVQGAKKLIAERPLEYWYSDLKWNE
ncbi:hypothetical protein [Cohnella sp. 56]|uniref:hypothetical protein n=1 Tax=Cohnella sp. 56 TaxID=3113722 RepID=UPI0030E81486